MLGFLCFCVVWLLGSLGGLALFNYWVSKEEEQERNLFFNDDVEDMHPVFFLFGPFSIILLLIVKVCMVAKKFLVRFKVGG